jgi:hypothetical protein
MRLRRHENLGIVNPVGKSELGKPKLERLKIISMNTTKAIGESEKVELIGRWGKSQSHRKEAIKVFDSQPWDSGWIECTYEEVDERDRMYNTLSCRRPVIF